MIRPASSLFVAMLFLLALLGCGQADAPGNGPGEGQGSSPANAPGNRAADTEDSASAPAAPESLDALRSRYADVPLAVVDVAEREYEGKNAIAITLSAPVDPTANLQPFLSVAVRKGASVDGAWILSPDKRILYFTATEPQTEYEVVVHPGLPGLNGKTLATPTSQALTTRDVPPAVGFLGEGSILPAKLSHGLPVSVVNVDEVSIDFHRLDPASIDDFLRSLQDSYNGQFYRYDMLQQWGDLAYTGRFEIHPPRNTTVKTAIDLESIDALKEPGFYVAVMEVPGTYDYRRAVTHFVVTDIGLHARVYPGLLTVHAASLAEGKALAGLSVAIMDHDGNVTQERRTSPEGEARFEGELPAQAWVMARNSEHLALLPLDGPALDLSAFDLGNRPQRPQELFVYTPRDLFRPGETIDFSALLRDGDGQPTATIPLTARIVQPDGQAVHETVLQPGALGYYGLTFTLPGNAATGNWHLDITNLAGGVVSHRFKVEDFLPERMSLTFDAGRTTPLQFDRTATVEIPVAGMYLYGAPAAGNRLGSKVDVSLLREAMPQFPGFFFGNEREADASAQFDLPDLFLDAQGQGVVRIDSRWASVRSPLQVSVTSSLYESGGRPVTRRYRATIFPGTPQFGVKPSFADTNPPADSQVDFDLILVGADGQPRDAQGVQVDLVREDRQYFWVFSEGEGWHYEFSEKEYVDRSLNVDLAAAQPTRVTFAVNWGRYRLEVKDTRDGTLTTVRFHAGEDWYADWQESRRVDKSMRPDLVTLALDKESYRPGDTARMQVNAPHAGEALVLVEGDQPLWMRRVTLEEPSATVEIPVGSDWKRHDLHVSVVVLRPASQQEQITPQRAFGLIHLPLDRRDRQLTLTLEAPDKVVPESTLSANLTVTDATGSPLPEAYVTLAAVDVGVLNITDFATPDPLDGFFGRRAYTIDARDHYGKVIELNDFAKARIRFGGDGDLNRGGKEPKSEVQIVALFQGPVKLDEHGKAVVNLDLPWFNGKVRLMAVAFGPDQFASADHETTIAAPLVAEIGLPRFLAPGDRAQAALDLHNLSGQDRTLQVSLNATGGLLGELEQQSVALANEVRTTLTLPLEAVSTVEGTVAVEVTADGLEPLRRNWTLGLRPAYPAVNRQFTHTLAAGDSLALPADLTSGLFEDSAQVRLALGNRANLNLPAHLDNLLQYPYGCLEQTSSSAWPYALATPETLARLGLPGISASDRVARIDGALARLAGMQQASGGFGLWDTTSPEEHWLTAYVSDFLLTLQEQGFNGNKPMLDRALARLAEYVNRPGDAFEEHYTEDLEHYRFAYKAYAGYVLARTGQASLSALRILHDQYRGDASSPLPLMHLGIALQLAGDQARAADALSESLLKTREDKNWLGDYGSVIRDRALMIHLMLKHAVNSEQALNLSYRLASDIGGKVWLSTQERNALFLAGARLDEQGGESWQASLSGLDGSTPLSGQRNHYQSVAVADLQRSLTLANTGATPLHVVLDGVGYPIESPAPEAHGYIVRRQYFAASGEPRALDQVTAGDLVLVHLDVRADDEAPNTLVVDLLPAGFELENQNLEHTLKLDAFQIEGKPVNELRGGTLLRHQEFRGDRYVAAVDLRGDTGHLFYVMRAVTPGEYRVPPTRVEDMYRPERHAIGASPDRVRVLAR